MPNCQRTNAGPNKVLKFQMLLGLLLLSVLSSSAYGGWVAANGRVLCPNASEAARGVVEMWDLDEPSNRDDLGV